jgi:hypothetical protein
LVDALKDVMKGFGGNKMSNDVEFKARHYVHMILNNAFKNNGLRIDGEIEQIIFNEKLRPDLQVVSNNDKETTLYMIEVKKGSDRERRDIKIEEALG